MAKTKEITIGEQKFTLQSVSPSWYYDFNDECGNTGSGKRKSAKYMDGMFKNCVVAPAEVKAKGMEFFDDNEDLKTAEKLISAIEQFLRSLTGHCQRCPQSQSQQGLLVHGVVWQWRDLHRTASNGSGGVPRVPSGQTPVGRTVA